MNVKIIRKKYKILFFYTEKSELWILVLQSKLTLNVDCDAE